jgi:nucleoid-associated protein YgaU
MKSRKLVTTFAAAIVAVGIMAVSPLTASAHCDTMDGPTVADGMKSLESGNVNYAMKWVQPDYTQELTDAFNLSLKVKDLSPEGKEIAEKYFYDTLVRIHRAGEGAPFDGVKPHGTPIDEKVLAADKSIEAGNLSPLDGMIEEEKAAELEERFEKVMALKDFDVNNVKEGREYIEAYVKFFKFAEGEEEHAGGAHGEAALHEGNAHEAEKSYEERVTYTVKTGDMLWKIAEKYNTTYQEIQKLNNIENPNLIYPGQVFSIPVK